MREELQQIYKKLKNYVDRKVAEIPVSTAGGSADPIIFTTTKPFLTATCNKSFEEVVENFRNRNFNFYVNETQSDSNESSEIFMVPTNVIFIDGTYPMFSVIANRFEGGTLMIMYDINGVTITTME